MEGIEQMDVMEQVKAKFINDCADALLYLKQGIHDGEVTDKRFIKLVEAMETAINNGDWKNLVLVNQKIIKFKF